MYIGTCGPGTFVTTMLKGRSRVTLRPASASSVDGVHSAICVSTDAPTACFDRFSSSVCAAMIWSCFRGSASATGSGSIHAETRFPSVPRSSSVRTLTGAMMRNSIVAGFTCRRRRKRRTAPVTTVSTMSFSDPPIARRTALMSLISIGSQSKRRCGPISPLSGVSEPVCMEVPSALATARMRVAASRRVSVASRITARMFPKVVIGSVAQRVISARSSSSPLGIGRGMNGAGSGTS